MVSKLSFPKDRVVGPLIKWPFYGLQTGVIKTTGSNWDPILQAGVRSNGQAACVEIDPLFERLPYLDVPDRKLGSMVRISGL